MTLTQSMRRALWNMRRGRRTPDVVAGYCAGVAVASYCLEEPKIARMARKAETIALRHVILHARAIARGTY